MLERNILPSATLVLIFGAWLLGARFRASSAALVLGITGALTMACTPIYIAPAAKAPLFAGSGEVHVSGHLGETFEGQAAVAVADQFGVVASISGVSNESQFLGTTYEIEHRSGEVGGGWFRPNSGNERIEILGGVGYGSSDVKSDGIIEDSGQYLRLFLQANLGLAEPNAEIALVSRLAYVSYTYDLRDMMSSSEAKSTIFAEPTGVVRVGGKRIKAEFQLGLVLPLTETDVDWTPIHISIGIHAVFGGSSRGRTARR